MAHAQQDRRSNKKKSFEKRSQATSSPHRKGKTGLVSELPVLQCGDGITNYAAFKKVLVPYCQKEYPYLAKFFKTGEYYDPPEYEYDEDMLHRRNDPFGLYADEVKQALKQRREIIKDMEEHSLSMYGLIWGQLSDNSIQTIQRHPDFDAKEIGIHCNDPLELWKVITATHVSTSSGDDVFDKHDSRQGYAGLKQEPHETLLQFKERFDDAVTTLELRKEHVPPPEDQAIDFIQKLDPLRYAAFQLHVRNNAHSEDPPSNLAEAFRRAGTFKVAIVRPRNDGSAHTVLMANADLVATEEPPRRNRDKGNKQGGNKGNKGKKQGGNKGRDNRKSDNKPNEPKRKTVGCYLCKGEDHFAKHCPSLGLCQRIIAKRSAARDDDHEEEALVASATKKKKEKSRARSSKRDEDVSDESDVDVHVHDAIASKTTKRRNVWYFDGFGDEIVNAIHVAKLKSTDVLLDNQASKGIFKEKSLLTDIHHTDIITTFNGIGGSVVTDMVGTSAEFGEISYSIA
jgi:hypothetical protein